MARTKDGSTFLTELGSGALYKRTQGRVTRQLTAVAISIVILIGCWTLSNWMQSNMSFPRAREWSVGIATALGALGLWATFRLVNYPRFADFLIAVEAEMNKVSWADRTYLLRATIVVIALMVMLGMYLSLCDIFWLWFFDLINFLDIKALKAQ